MNVLVDTSVWIDYLRNRGRAEELDMLIGENLIVVNELILAELLPPLMMRNQSELISLFNEIRKCTIAIDWQEIIELQTVCLGNGISGVGIPDLIITQNALQGRLALMTNDNKFRLLAKYTQLELYE